MSNIPIEVQIAEDVKAAVRQTLSGYEQILRPSAEDPLRISLRISGRAWVRFMDSDAHRAVAARVTTETQVREDVTIVTYSGPATFKALLFLSALLESSQR